MTITIAAPAVGHDAENAARFARQVEPLLEGLHRVAARRTRSSADAEDLVQETLLRAFAGFHTFEQGTNFKAWVFRILINQWINAHRAKQARPQEISVPDVAEHAGASRRSAAAPSAETALLEELPSTDITAAIAALPAGFGEVLFYADVRGHTYAEIAEMLDIPIGTVMSRIHRARRRMRLALAHRSPAHTAGQAVDGLHAAEFPRAS